MVFGDNGLGGMSVLFLAGVAVKHEAVYVIIQSQNMEGAIVQLTARKIMTPGNVRKLHAKVTLKKRTLN